MTLCIPVFNGARHLDAALQSAREQTFDSLEILVVDDCSTDESVAVAHRHASADPRVRVVVNDSNLGLVGNWLRCVELARGTHLKYLFHDDLLDPGCIQVLWDGMQQSGAAVGFVARRLVMEGLSTKMARQLAPIEHRNLASMLERSRFVPPDEVADLALVHGSVNVLGEPTSVMLRRDVFDRFGGFDARFQQLCDWEYWLRVGVNEGLWFEVSPFASFRLHPAAMSLRNKQHAVSTVYGEAALLSCKILRDEHFQPLRRRAAELSPPIDLTQRAVRRLLRLRLRAKQARSAVGLAAATAMSTEYSIDIDVPRWRWLLEWGWMHTPEPAQRLIDRLRTHRGGGSPPGGMTPDDRSR